MDYNDLTTTTVVEVEGLSAQQTETKQEEKQPPPKTGDEGIYVKAIEDCDNDGKLLYEAWELLPGGKLRFGSTYARQGKWSIDSERGGQMVFTFLDIGWEPMCVKRS